MIPPLVILVAISARFILDPAHAAAKSGVALTTPEAMTDTRVVGGMTLTISALIASSIFSRHRLRMGHATIATMMAWVLAVRMFGFMTDGTTLAMGDQRVKTTGEVVFLLLNVVGYAVQTWRAERAEGQR
jgi:hypothetical protein